MMGGKVKGMLEIKIKLFSSLMKLCLISCYHLMFPGGRILGQHPANYNLSDPQITGRGAWIPTTSNEAMWVSKIMFVCHVIFVLDNITNTLHICLSCSME